MTPNIGTTDRVIRIIFGLALLSLIFLLDGNARWWGLLGLGPLLTAFVRYCPPYKLLGIDTLGKKKENVTQ
jgi:hypothetical protein